MTLAVYLLATLALGTPPSATPVRADTVEITPAEALERARATSPRLEAALARGRQAAGNARQETAWANPVLAMSVDNIGAEEEVTGIAGARGLEGQAVLGFTIPLGGDRGAAIRRSDALARASSARADATAVDVTVMAVHAVASAQRDRVLARLAAREAETLDALAGALTLQAAEGRISEGDAARARLEATLAGGTAADAAAVAAASGAEAARLLGYPVDTNVRLRADACRLPTLPDTTATPPGLQAARADAEAADAGLDGARAARIPDIAPQVGVRRTMGVEALYVGLNLELPLFNRRSAAADAAAAARDASRAQLALAEASLGAERAAAREAVMALEGAGSRFRQGWVEDLAAAVEATEARYAEGEGTLTELLDGRRARLQALASRERWRAAWRVQRARLWQLSGADPGPDIFCDPLAGPGQ